MTCIAPICRAHPPRVALAAIAWRPGIVAFIAAALGATTPDAAPELLRQRRLERAY